MSKKQQDEQWLTKARAALDEQLATYDATALSRLQQARERAVASLDRRETLLRQWGWLQPVAIAASLAVVIVLSVAVFQQPASDSTLELIDTARYSELSEELEWAAVSDDIDLYAQLEFLLWLDQQTLDHHAG